MIIISYDVQIGIQDPAVVAAKVAAIPIDQGGLELIGAVVVSDTTVILGDFVRRTIVLEFTPEGLVLFPTAADQVLATTELFKNILAAGTPALVTPGDPVFVDTECFMAWLDADQGVTTEGGDVSEWQPALGTAAPFAQANPALQPTHVEADPDWDGQDSVDFDPADVLVSDDPPAFWTPLHNGDGATLIFLVRPTAVDEGQVVFSTYDGTAPDVGVQLVYNGTTENFTFTIGNGVADSSVSSAPGSNPPNENYRVVIGYRDDIATLSLIVNDVETTAPAPATFSDADPQNTATLGSALFDGTIPDVFLFSCILTNEQVDAIIGELAVPPPAPPPAFPPLPASSLASCQVIWETAEIPGTLTLTDFANIPIGASCATFTFEMEDIEDGIEFLVHWRNADGTVTVGTAVDSSAITPGEPMLVPTEYVQWQSPTGPPEYDNFDHTVAIPAGKVAVALEIVSRSIDPGTVRITVCFK